MTTKKNRAKPSVVNDKKISGIQGGDVRAPVLKNKTVIQALMVFVRSCSASFKGWAYDIFVLPFKMPDGVSKNEKAEIICRSVFNILSLLALVIMPVMSFKYGMTGDEHTHVDYGNKVFNYFFHGDPAAQQADPENEMQYKGPLFDLFVATFYHAFHLWAYYTTMHFFNALLGAIGIIYAGKLGKLLDSWLTGILVLIFLLLSPSWFGHNFANPKDIPFSVGYTAGLYYIILFLKALPDTRSKHLLGLICSFGFGIGVRIGGLLLMPYLVLFTGIYIMVGRQPQKVSIGKVAGQLIFVCILGYLLSVVCWPYAHLDIAQKPIEALKAMSNYFQDIGMLYEGKYLSSQLVPWYYIPKYILLTAPVVVLVGAFLGCVDLGLLFTKNRNKFLFTSFVLVSFAFPVVYVIYKASNLYDGWRHFLFIYPPLVVVAAVGWSAVLRARNKIIVSVTAIAIVVGLFLPLRYSVANHPFEYIYFNEFAGGVKNINGKYETDYYMLGIRPATEWLIKNEHLEHRKVIIATNCIFPLLEYTRPYKNIQPVYVKLYERDSKDWDYCVLFSRFVNASQILSGNWPPPEAIHTIDVDGVPIAVVLKRKTKLDIPGFALMKANKPDEAKNAFLASLKEYPDNEMVWEQLACIYEDEAKLDSSILAAQNALKQYPGNYTLVQLAGRAYLKQNKQAQALQLFTALGKYDQEYSHYLLGFYYGMTGNEKRGFEEVEQTILINKYNERAYKLGIKIAKKFNDKLMASEYSDRYRAMFMQSDTRPIQE